jgi:hypothetical protein
MSSKTLVWLDPRWITGALATMGMSSRSSQAGSSRSVASITRCGSPIVRGWPEFGRCPGDRLCILEIQIRKRVNQNAGSKNNSVVLRYVVRWVVCGEEKNRSLPLNRPRSEFPIKAVGNFDNGLQICDRQ